MVVLIDTNVALDFLTVRQPFYQSAKAILKACASDDMQGYIAFIPCPISSTFSVKAILMRTDVLCWKNSA